MEDGVSGATEARVQVGGDWNDHLPDIETVVAPGCAVLHGIL